MGALSPPRRVALWSRRASLPDVVSTKDLKTHKYGCVMALLPATLRKEITDWTLENVPDWHVGKGGYEFTPHVTIKYGLKAHGPDVVAELDRVFRRHGPIAVRLAGLSLFEGNDDGDVLKIDVDSPQLHSLNALIAATFPCHDKYPEYKPHLTLAYVNPAVSGRYAALTPPFVGDSVVVDEVEFSAPDGSRTRFALGWLPRAGTKPLAAWGGKALDDSSHPPEAKPAPAAPNAVKPPSFSIPLPKRGPVPPRLVRRDPVAVPKPTPPKAAAPPPPKTPPKDPSAEPVKVPEAPLPATPKAPPKFEERLPAERRAAVAAQLEQRGLDRDEFNRRAEEWFHEITATSPDRHPDETLHEVVNAILPEMDRERQASGRERTHAARARQMATPTQTPPEWSGSKAQVTVAASNPKAFREYVNQVVGRPTDLQDLASVVGAPDHAQVEVKRDPSGRRIVINTVSPQYVSDRYLIRDEDGELSVLNDSITVAIAYQGTGIGTTVFTNQVQHARKMGVARIRTYAAGSVDVPGVNGYYTWARLGYDWPIGPGRLVSKRLRQKLDRYFPGVETVHDVLLADDVQLPPQERADTLRKLNLLDRRRGLPERERDRVTGSDWWLLHGEASHEATFDLADGSRSLHVLHAYLAERAARERGKGLRPVNTPRKPDLSKYELITLTAEQEADLDRAWARVRAARVSASRTKALPAPPKAPPAPVARRPDRPVPPAVPRRAGPAPVTERVPPRPPYLKPIDLEQPGTEFEAERVPTPPPPPGAGAHAPVPAPPPPPAAAPGAAAPVPPDKPAPGAPGGTPLAPTAPLHGPLGARPKPPEVAVPKPPEVPAPKPEDGASPAPAPRPGWETFATATVRRVEPINMGANKSYHMTLDDGKGVVFKPKKGEMPRIRPWIRGDYYLREAATADLAHTLGLGHLVPPTVVRKAEGEIGSAQEFVPDTDAAGALYYVTKTQAKAFDGNDDLSLAAAFDYLTGNSDRHLANWLVRKSDGKLVLIDHGLNFPDNPDNWKNINDVIIKRARARKLRIPDAVKKWAGRLDEIADLLKQYGLNEAEIDGVRRRANELAAANSFESLYKPTVR